MIARDPISTLPTFPSDDLQEEIAPIRVHIWNTSWIERLALVIGPILLLTVFLMTPVASNSECWMCWDEQFFHSAERSHAGISVFNLPRYHLFGIVVSEPKPLISKDALIELTKKQQVSVDLGFAPSRMVYPQSLIQEATISATEYAKYHAIIRALLIGWVGIGLWNLLRYVRREH